jgi:hypothetical protein
MMKNRIIIMSLRRVSLPADRHVGQICRIVAVAFDLGRTQRTRSSLQLPVSSFRRQKGLSVHGEFIETLSARNSKHFLRRMALRLISGAKVAVRRCDRGGVRGVHPYTRLSREAKFLSNQSDRVELGAETTEGEEERSVTSSSKTSAYLQLAKAKLSALVVATTAAGFVAAGGPLSEQATVAGSVVIGTALCASSAAALNQIFEVDRDSRMKRTQQRPLVTGELSIGEATTAAALWGVAGTSLLAIGTDPITTALGLGNIGLYAGLYTYMKPRTIYNVR